MVGTAGVGRREAAAVRGEQFQPRVPVQGTVEDQVGQGERRLRRLAAGVAEELGAQPAPPGWMKTTAPA
jgi:hypothetical protein